MRMEKRRAKAVLIGMRKKSKVNGKGADIFWWAIQNRNKP